MISYVVGCEPTKEFCCLDCVMHVEGDRGDQVSIDFSGYTGNKLGSEVSIGLGGVDVSVVGSEQGIDGKLVQERFW